MRVRERFTNHPASVGETYGEHMRVALTFAGALVKAAGAASIHAFLPFLFTTTASQLVKKLHDRMARRCANCPKVALHRPDLVPMTRPTAPVLTGNAALDYVI